MPEHRIRVHKDGTIEFIDKPELAALKSEGATTKRRASHVEPARRLWRILFHVLRWVFGESGSVATFTRIWPVWWRVNLSPSNGPILGQLYSNRKEAIAAEVRWLQESGNGADPRTLGCSSCGYEAAPAEFNSNLDEPICPQCLCPYLYEKKGTTRQPIPYDGGSLLEKRDSTSVLDGTS
jgi:hypothetical protein